MIVLEGSFYGRTYRPARLSHSCRSIYQQHLASFQHAECHLPMVVPANNVAALERAFAQAEAQNLHVEAMYMEPVMGEGNPGETLKRDFYDAARRLTKAAHSLLVVDSIQAALRAKGTLSIVDYPGFTDAEAPDMETYSKALNAGQFPLSGARCRGDACFHWIAVLALQEHVARKYAVGLYGNTMTTNPRALDIATDMLRAVTPAIRANIVARGEEFQSKFGALCKKHPQLLAKVTGSGLLQAVHLQPAVPMFGGNHTGSKSFLAACRHAGIGVIKCVHPRGRCPSPIAARRTPSSSRRTLSSPAPRSTCLSPPSTTCARTTSCSASGLLASSNTCRARRAPLRKTFPKHRHVPWDASGVRGAHASRKTAPSRDLARAPACSIRCAAYSMCRPAQCLLTTSDRAALA